MRGRGSPGDREGGGGRFFIENPGGGGSPKRGWEGARGPEGVCKEFGGIGGGGGGGATYFFSGPKCPPRDVFVRTFSCSKYSVSTPLQNNNG